MTTLTVASVRAWRPHVLADAAVGVAEARDALDAQVREAKDTVGRLCEVWQGAAADAAADRLAREATTGYALADALDHAHAALQDGARDIGTARDALLAAVVSIEGAGFVVGPDGSVAARVLPPVMTEPGDPTGAAAARAARQHGLDAAAHDHARQVSAALGLCASADERTAAALGGIEVPQTLESAVRAYLSRLAESHDAVHALGLTGAGGVQLALAVKKAVGAYGKTRSYAQFLSSSFAPITDYQTMVANFDDADAALRELSVGAKDGGLLGKVIGVSAAKLVGKAFLPLTVVTGGVDAVTGGGYEGARGWATRGFGAAGAIGAGALIASSVGLVALGPVGLAVAGAAVLAYGAWSLGNLVYDNREAIGHFFASVGGRVAGGATAAWNATTDAVAQATGWAERQVDGAAHAVEDAGKGLLRTVSFGFL